MSKTVSTTHHGLKAQPPYPWFTANWSHFTRQVEERRLPHAILLVGPDGIGCVDFALAMAQYLLCVAPQNGQSCGHCKSCHLIQVEGHPDLHVITQEVNAKTKKLAQSIKIDQIRRSAEETANTSQQGGRKLVVIHPAEAMNPNAANALLKNLEEPSGDCIYILVSEQAAFLMATIRSRCSRMVLSLPARSDAVAWLERNKITDAQKRLDDVGGRPLKVISWLEHDVWGQRERLLSEIQKLLLGDVSFLDCAKAVSGSGPLWLIEQMQSVLTTAIACSGGGRNSESAGSLLEILKSKSQRQLFRLYDALIEKKKLVLSTANPNPQLLIEEILMQIEELKHKTR